MYILLLILHIVACFILIATILLQAGRGGGLTDALGGGETAQSVLGTQAPVVLKKATTISAVVFLVTSLLLGMVAARSGRSLFDQMRIPAAAVAGGGENVPTLPPITPPEEAAPLEEPDTASEVVQPVK